jgi:NADPH:quinone reductase-like Zn-dependent oxidoreductase
MSIPHSMRAVVLDAPGPPEALRVGELPVPTPDPGRVLIRVTASGLNRSELHTRLGLAEGVTFPRVPGIEATGYVAACPGGEFAPGGRVVAMTGGMGRRFDGGYAEYTSVPATQVIGVHTDLDDAVLGAVPEMLQTAADRRARRAAGGDAPDPRRDVVGRAGHRGAREAAGDDGARDEPRPRPVRPAHRRRGRPRRVSAGGKLVVP